MSTSTENVSELKKLTEAAILQVDFFFFRETKKIDLEKVAERSVNHWRFIVKWNWDIRSENADMSNEKSCEIHDSRKS